MWCTHVSSLVTIQSWKRTLSAWNRIKSCRNNPIRVDLCSSIRCRGAERKHVFLYPNCSYTILCESLMDTLSSSAIPLTCVWWSDWITARHSLPSVVDMLGRPNICLSQTCVRPLSNYVHQIHNIVTLTRSTLFLKLRWISAGGVFFRHKKTYHISYFNGRPRFRQRFHLLAENAACYCTTNSLYRHCLNSVIVLAVQRGNLISAENF